MRWFPIVVLLLFTSVVTKAQLRAYDWSQLDSLQKQEQRLMFVFVHTDWCKYCLKMKQTILKDSLIVQELNDHYYFISFNAEQSEPVIYQGMKFPFIPSGNKTGVHSLAKQIGTINGQLNFPALVILNIKNEILFQYSGWMSSEELYEVLKTAQLQLKGTK